MSFDADSAPNVNTLWAHVLVDEFARCGLKRVCIAPGSRSAPLVFQFASHPDIEDISIIDERSAAFYALGLARATGEPVALLCTSGTAAANFLPAVCEASADDVPLLVLTGNRPPEDRECGAQQVMEQHRLYGTHARWFRELPQPEAAADKLRFLRALACRAWAATGGARPGPVHLDVPLRKPLEPIAAEAGQRDGVPDPLPADVCSVADGRPRRAPWVRLSSARGVPDEAALQRVAERIAEARRPLLVAGTDARGTSYRTALRDFAEAAGIPVLAEAGSGLRHWRARGENVLGAGELIAAGGFYQGQREPDLIVRTGHVPLTWAMQDLVSAERAAVQVHIGGVDRVDDPQHVLTEQIVACPVETFRNLADRAPAADAARRDWLAGQRRAEQGVLTALAEAMPAHPAPSAPRLWHELGTRLPDGCSLYYSSSMLVRHLETFMADHDRDLSVHFNRGLNGIDGVVSTGCGIARARPGGPNLLVIGDVALRHDAGALLLALEHRLDLTVVVVDNDGGEIFEYLPSAGFEAVHRKHFATAGVTPVSSALPRAVPVHEPSSWDAFGDAVGESLDAGGLQVIRMVTERTGDVALRRTLLTRAAEVIAGLADPGFAADE